MLKNRIRRQITLPPELDKKLVAQAEKEHRTCTNLLEKIIIEYFQKEGK